MSHNMATEFYVYGDEVPCPITKNIDSSCISWYA